MKRFWLVFLCTLLSIPLIAQRDPTIPDTVDHKVSNQESWYNDALPEDLPPYRDSVLVNTTEIPAKLRKVLSGKDEFGGWENGKIYYDRASKVYKVYIHKDADVTVYGFTPDGRPVSFRSFTRKQ
jgi:hypothetical protein